jgi:hypothetical protein
VFFSSVLVEEFVPDPTQREIVNIGLAGSAGYPVGSGSIAQPANLALVITWRTDFPGRRGRGRMYMTGQWVRNSDGLKWQQTNLDIAEGLASTIRNHYTPLNNANALELCVFSRLMGGRVPPYNTSGAHAVVAHTIQRYYASMGSRRLGHGL